MRDSHILDSKSFGKFSSSNTQSGLGSSIRSYVPDSASSSQSSRRRCSPTAAFLARFGLFEKSVVERIVKADTLKTDTSNLESSSRVELASFVDVLGRGVLSVS